ncbi:flagellar basal body-associated FliL family protein [Sphingomonas sp. TX0543]|uniref:flagellar basal body-associated FliL family protein n=1 Tax=unclassified Sphingomonas TaxID=196159 RepID=UPI0010F8D943|nr:flagellar basal body-associated FliL family protein [Sphingomonas sp. 3P27F8]
MSDTDAQAAAPARKKKKLPKIILLVVGALVLIGGGVGAGLYAAGSGIIGGKSTAHEKPGPKLVPKSEQKHAGEGKEEGGHGGGESAEAKPAENHGMPTPAGEGGDRYASNYYAMEKDFTANLQDSVHFLQVGIAISTPYDDTVIRNIKTNDIAVRSAILMALGDTGEDQVFTSDGKQALAKRLAVAINKVLKEKEGFGGVGNVYFTNFVVQ